MSPQGNYMRYQGTRFSSGVVELDDNEFENCVFEDAVLAYGGGPVALDGCTFSGGVRWAFRGQLASGLFALGRLFADNPELGLRIVGQAMWPTAKE